MFAFCFMQDNWDPDWQSTSSSKVAYVVQKLKELQEANSNVDCPLDDNNNAMRTDNLVCLSEMSNSKELRQVHDFKRTTKTHETNLEKVLVFSQFLEHIHVIEQQVTIVYHTLLWICVVMCVCISNGI